MVSPLKTGSNDLKEGQGMTDKRLNLFLLYSLVGHLIFLFILVMVVRISPATSSIFTEVTLVGVLPKGDQMVPSGKRGSQVKIGHAEDKSGQESKSKDEILLARRKAKAREKAKTLEKVKALKKQLIAEAVTQNRQAPIGLQELGDQGPDSGLAQEGQGMGTRYGVPQGTALNGPIAQRGIRYSETPSYPEWARQQGVDASVTLRIVVLPGGMVDSNVSIVKTSGYRELDQDALQSVRKWQFEPLPPSLKQENQTGEVTFSFHLH